MSQVEDGLVSLVEQQVKDGKVGLETMLLLIHLIIGCGLKARVGQRLLGADGITEVICTQLAGIGIVVGQLQVGAYVKQFAQFVCDGQRRSSA